MTDHSPHFLNPDYLNPDYLAGAEVPAPCRAAIAQLRQAATAQRQARSQQRFAAAAQETAHFLARGCDLDQPVVTVGQASDLSPTQTPILRKALQVFCPWKKGPFKVFGTEIDAEWRSDWKWDRIAPHIQPLHQRRVADIGCHNGYFMFRMAAQSPRLVVGFEPVAKHYWAFQMIQNWVRHPALYFEALGVEHLDLYPGFFETIFCLGILYHHTDPVGLLRKMHQALVPGGELIVDCQGIPGEMPVALTPRKRYAQARGIWFLPTQSCLEHWILRSGFRQIQWIYAAPLSVQEQRRTDWAKVESLAEFLDPDHPDQTLEGYPAPWRFYALARRG
ncbi:tRNA 5-methoxyuridine(34)/uridine 5-oxyacetic acid(34) synthase CmoB [Lyngbya confervoides]|uniref:tRNA U34 carboxymethyltransferase n=1 Tax=Lyngbya confervoides BDU141951 TaxID=1574623 RepID=A0ABD4T8F4_9CYAN|nr:tRNA 5-methoxyuridine(34)/uridine 5-oxyacetic acid(34) synthase CmoB [Lyngbya confervoides]MCM1984597.1 tRNA 5-methoxyuridine(34)/uridine 5-oxyacetic acid(34) synthase CmoB [Lyngbya confervoides BDU141951]